MKPMDPTCIFCQIIARQAPASSVFENEAAIAFLDINPLFPGHTLVVPKTHHVTLPDLPTDQLAPYFATVQLLTSAVQTACEAQGIFVAQNNIVSQTVHHLHVHLVPRNQGDGLRGFFWPRNPYRDVAHQEEVRLAIAEEAARLTSKE